MGISRRLACHALFAVIASSCRCGSGSSTTGETRPPPSAVPAVSVARDAGEPHTPIPPLRFSGAKCVKDARDKTWCWEGPPLFDSHASPFLRATVRPVSTPMSNDDIEGRVADRWETCTLHADGSVTCAPNPGTPSSALPAVTFSGPVRQLAYAGSRICALDAAAALWCWGGDDNRKLEKWHLPPVARIEPGATVGCATTETRAVWCWGYTRPRDPWQPPKQVPGASDVASVMVGGTFACALQGDGTVWCWGPNEHAQLGFARGMFHESARPVPGLRDIISMGLGGAHVCALRSDHQVLCWGGNEYFESRPQEMELEYCKRDDCPLPEGRCMSLSRDYIDGNREPFHPYIRCPTPQAIVDVAGATQIAADGRCAIVQDSRVLCWGSLGGGFPTPTPPIEVRWNEP
jgi:hypothetical protein